MNRATRSYIKGLTLVEILTVMALVGVLAAVALPAMSGGGMNVFTGGQLVGDQITLARQTAVTRNRPIEVRFIEDKRDSGYSALQIWEYDASGDNPKPLRRLEKLPDAVIIKKETSPALSEADAGQRGTANFRPLGTASYAAIRFRPNGRVETSLPMAKNYLTVAGRRDNAERPRNYYTLQVSPLTGRVSSHQP